MKKIVDPRSNLYGVLTGYYLGVPTEKQIEIILSEDFLDGLSGHFSSDVLKSFRRFKEKNGSTYDSLKQEYTNLFVVPTGQYVTPYENVYRGKRIEKGKEFLGMLQGPYTISVKEEYNRAGAEIDKGYQDLPDFIGLEFSFMKFLCEREQKAWENGNNNEALELLSLEKAFLENHLVQWVPELCTNVQAYTENDFILGMSRLTQAFLKIEMETLEDVEVPAGS